MDYKKLEGNTILLNNSIIEVKTIEELVCEYTQVSTFIINGHPKEYSQFDIAQQLNILLSNNENYNSRFGLYFNRFEKLNTKEVGLVFGIREYGFHKCGIFTQIPFYNKLFCLEFSFSEKSEYESGVLPYQGEPGINVVKYIQSFVKKIRK